MQSSLFTESPDRTDTNSPWDQLDQLVSRNHSSTRGRPLTQLNNPRVQGNPGRSTLPNAKCAQGPQPTLSPGPSGASYNNASPTRRCVAPPLSELRCMQGQQLTNTGGCQSTHYGGGSVPAFRNDLQTQRRCLPPQAIPQFPSPCNESFYDTSRRNQSAVPITRSRADKSPQIIRYKSSSPARLRRLNQQKQEALQDRCGTALLPDPSSSQTRHLIPQADLVRRNRTTYYPRAFQVTRSPSPSSRPVNGTPQRNIRYQERTVNNSIRMQPLSREQSQRQSRPPGDIDKSSSSDGVSSSEELTISEQKWPPLILAGETLPKDTMKGKEYEDSSSSESD